MWKERSGTDFSAYVADVISETIGENGYVGRILEGVRVLMAQIKITKCPIEGLYVIEPTVHGDARGYFIETYNQRDMAEFG